MEFENLIHSKDLDEKPIDYLAIVNGYLYYWKLFFISALGFLALSFVYLRYTPAKYQVSTTILIDDKENGMLSSELSAFEDLGIIANQKTSLDTEITVLKGRTLIRKVIKNLKFNISYDHIGRVKNREIYHKHSPFKVNFIVKDSIFYKLDTSFIINAKSMSNYILRDLDGNKLYENKFGEIVSLTFGKMIVTPNQIDKLEVGEEVIVNIRPLKAVSGYYREEISIIPESKKSNGLVIGLTDQLKSKAEDILNELVKQYNKDVIDDKSLIARNTDEFISLRIDDISKELEIIDKGVEEYKVDNRLTDINREASLVLESNSDLERKIVELNSQIRVIDYVIDYMKNNKNDLIPSNLGLKDETASESTILYNQLMLERNRIVKSSSQMNPTVINLESQIVTLRGSIERSLINSRRSLSFSLSESRSQESRLNIKRAMAPRQEREFQDMKRKQQIIESLYLYLLQKREENAITLAVPEPNAKVVDLADGSNIPISPKKISIHFIFVLIGLILPFMYIFIQKLLDNKIHTKEDIESIVHAPILGDIPSSNTDSKIIISEKDNSNIAESFRLLRTNINFMLLGVHNGAKSIFITSSIAGEGKTIIAINLAISLGLIDKKVLLISADIRKPKLTSYLNVEVSGYCLTHYLVDKKIKIFDLIKPTNHANLSIIQSGAVPPNPSELFTNSRFEEIIAYGKENYDYIIVDTAPVGIVTDTLLLAHNADLFVYVIRVNYLEKSQLKSIRSLHETKRLPNMAILMNGIDYKKKSYGYGYGYGYQ